MRLTIYNLTRHTLCSVELVDAIAVNEVIDAVEVLVVLKIFEHTGEVRQLAAQREENAVVVECVRRLQGYTTQAVASEHLVLAVHHRDGIVGERRHGVFVKRHVVLQELFHYCVVVGAHTSSLLCLVDSYEAVGLCR